MVDAAIEDVLKHQLLWNPNSSPSFIHRSLFLLRSAELKTQNQNPSKTSTLAKPVVETKAWLISSDRENRIESESDWMECNESTLPALYSIKLI